MDQNIYLSVESVIWERRINRLKIFQIILRTGIKKMQANKKERKNDFKPIEKN